MHILQCESEKKTKIQIEAKITGYTARSTTGLYQLKCYSLGFKSGYYLGHYYHEHEKERLAHLHCFKTNQIGGSLQALFKKKHFPFIGKPNFLWLFIDTDVSKK